MAHNPRVAALLEEPDHVMEDRDRPIKRALQQIYDEAEPIQFSDAHRKGIEDAKMSFLKKMQMNTMTMTMTAQDNEQKRKRDDSEAPATLNEDEKRAQKKTIQEYNKKRRFDKKRHKRKQVEESDSWTQQAMQIMDPPVQTTPEFTTRTEDMPIVRVEDKDGNEDLQATLPLALQKFYVANRAPPPTVPDDGVFMSPNMEIQPASHRSVCERHLQAMSSQSNQYSFVVNLLMHQRQCNVPIHMLPEVDTYLASVRDITRDEEESFLRQPIPGQGERECAEGKNCEGFFVMYAYVRFALVEYQPPEVREEFRTTGKWPEKRGVCIMCRRKLANYVYDNVMARCAAYDYSSIEQASRERAMSDSGSGSAGDVHLKPLMVASFGNIVGENEYSPWDVQISLISHYTALFKPIVLHRRYMYRQEKRNGVWYFAQIIPRPQRNLRAQQRLDEAAFGRPVNPNPNPNPGTSPPQTPSANARLKFGELLTQSLPKKKNRIPNPDCIGPFWREDAATRQKRRFPSLQAIAPYFHRSSGRLLRWDVPHICVNNWLAQRRRAPLPRFVIRTEGGLKDIQRRIDYLQNLMDRGLPAQILQYPEMHVPGSVPETEEPPDPMDPNFIRRQIIYLQDRSQMLMLRLENISDSRNVRDMKISPDQLVEALKGPWRVCSEGLHAVVHDGLLPDLAPILQFLPLWNRTHDNSFDHDPFVKSVLRIFVKSVFQPSKVREINRSLCNELREPRVGDRGPKVDRRRILDLLSRLMFCSMGGLYPHAKYTVSYETRRELYRWLWFDVPNIEEMRMWMLDHKLLLTFILREYHIFHIDSVPGLRRVFEELYEYPSIHTNVLHNMDRVRVRFDEGVRNVLRILETFFRAGGAAPSRRDEAPKSPRRGSAPDPVSTPLGTPQRDLGRSPKEGSGEPAPQHEKDWRRRVAHSTFTIDCALLDNDGSCIYYFCQKYKRNGMQDLMREFFWRFTFIGRFEQFSGMLPAEMEVNVREIVLYWLLLKEHCRHASLKQTKRDYLECINQIPPGEVVPALPPKAMAKPVFRNCMVQAQKQQHEVIRVFKCACPATNHEGCLLHLIVGLVENFDVHRVTRPLTRSPYIAYSTISDRLSIEKHLAQAYTSCLAWCYRPRLTTFADEMVSSCRTVRLLMRNSEGPENEKRKTPSDPMVARRFWEAKDLYEEKERDHVQRFIERVIVSFPPSREVSVEWMVVEFNVAYDSAKIVNKARRLMLSETNRRMPYNACYTIASLRPRDFWIIRDFFKARFQYESIRVYPISHDIAQKQVHTLHTKLNLVELGQPLPLSASTCYYCPDHRTMLAALVGTASTKMGYVNTLNIGPEGISVDPITGLKYCTSQSHRGDRRSIAPAVAVSVAAPGGAEPPGAKTERKR